MKKDIADRKHIELLMEVFYQKLLNDPGISYIFTEVAKIDLAHHLPIITDFWESTLLNNNVYHNNTMKVHTDLNARSKLSKEHFTIWLSHFHQTVDELFEGEIANRAKQRATSVATIMQIKMAQGL